MKGRGIVKTSILSRLEPILRDGLLSIIDDAKTNASWSAEIQKAIKLGNIKVDMSKGVITGTIILDATVAPQALAFEFGSGLHRKNREKSTYVIAPKSGGLLSFEWPGHEEKFPPGKKFVAAYGGKFFFHYVDHPGVEARPYLAPAREKNRTKIKEQLAKAFKQEFILSIRTGVQ